MIGTVRTEKDIYHPERRISMDPEETFFTVKVDAQGRVHLPLSVRTVNKIVPGKYITLRFVKFAE